MKKHDMKAVKQSLHAEIAKKSGVDEKDVAKVLATLGLQNHINEATNLMGVPPKLKDLLIGFHVSSSAVMV